MVTANSLDFGIHLLDSHDCGMNLLESQTVSVECENYRLCTFHGRTEQCLSGCIPEDCPRHSTYERLGEQK